MDTKKLRQKILDLAIRGKLVPQDPNDEPASVLLERIRAEKERLIKEGKIKRSKKSESSDKPHYENMPFEIPESWVWCRLEDLIVLLSGRDLDSKDCNSTCEGVPYLIGASNVDNEKINITRWTTKPIVISKYGDILISCKGTIGEIVHNTIGDTHIARQFMAIRNISSTITDYIEIFIKSIINDIKDNSRGVIPGISREDILYREMPVPPLNEQIKIITEVRKYLKFIDDIESDKIELESYIKQTKSKILDLAISGKLVPQDPTDEPAIELLKRINPNFIPCDNSHYENIEFDIPESWCWATIGNIFEHNTGKALNASNPNGMLLDYITTSNLYWDRFELSVVKQMPFTESEIERCVVTKGDLLVCEGGDVGRSAIWNYDYNIMIQNHIHRLRGKVDVCTRYFFYLFMYYKMCNLIGGKGVAIQGLSSRDLHNLIIPVPPMKEQHNIASSIDLYFSKLDAIAAELQ